MSNQSKKERHHYPCLSLSDLEDWARKFPDEREEMEAEIVRRKTGTGVWKPRRYEIAIENYYNAIKALQEVMSKTDINILCQRCRELPKGSHELELIRKELAWERLEQRYPHKFRKEQTDED